MPQQLPSPNSKYPFVGPNYIKIGERPGFLYNPWQDKYYPDPKAQQKYYEEQGLGPKEPPGLLEQLAPVAAGAGALELGKFAGGGVPGLIKEGWGALGGGSGILDKLGGLMGLGGGAGGAGDLAATPAANAAWNAAAMEATGAPMTLLETGATAPAVPGGMLSGAGAFALPALAAIAGAYGLKQGALDGYKSAEGKSPMDALKYQMSKPSSWLTPGPSALFTLAGSLFGSGKDEDQRARDAVRKDLQGKGLLDENWALDLGAGQKFDIGKDGSEALYNLDLSSPLSQENLKTIAPLAHIITGGDKKLGSDFAGYFTNAIQSAQDPFAAAKQMYSNFGVTTRDQARAELNKLADEGKLTREEVQVYDQGLANVFPDDNKKKK